jgi:hypothetical protein
MLATSSSESALYLLLASIGAGHDEALTPHCSSASFRRVKGSAPARNTVKVLDALLGLSSSSLFSTLAAGRKANHSNVTLPIIAECRNRPAVDHLPHRRRQSFDTSCSEDSASSGLQRAVRRLVQENASTSTPNSREANSDEVFAVSPVAVSSPFVESCPTAASSTSAGTNASSRVAPPSTFSDQQASQFSQQSSGNHLSPNFQQQKQRHPQPLRPPPSSSSSNSMHNPPSTSSSTFLVPNRPSTASSILSVPSDTNNIVRSTTPVFAQFENLYEPSQMIHGTVGNGDGSGLFGADDMDYSVFGGATGNVGISEYVSLLRFRCCLVLDV